MINKYEVYMPYDSAISDDGQCVYTVADNKDDEDNSDDNYKLHQSDYESDNEAYTPQEPPLGKGAQDKARLLIPKHKHKNTKPPKVVIEPFNKASYSEKSILAKLNFLRTQFGKENVRFFRLLDTVKIVAPLASGKHFSDVKAKNEKEILVLFLAAIQAIKKTHSHGLIIMDLHGKNIFYDPAKGACLIDGGSSVKKGERFDIYDVLNIKHSSTLTKIQESIIAGNYNKHFAPECVLDQEACANESMDIYALGHMIMRRITHDQLNIAHSLLKELIGQCMDHDPSERPDLEELEAKLNARLLEINQLEEKLNVSARAVVELLYNQTVGRDDKNEDFAPDSEKIRGHFACSFFLPNVMDTHMIYDKASFKRNL